MYNQSIQCCDGNRAMVGPVLAAADRVIRGGIGLRDERE